MKGKSNDHRDDERSDIIRIDRWRGSSKKKKKKESFARAKVFKSKKKMKKESFARAQHTVLGRKTDALSAHLCKGDLPPTTPPPATKTAEPSTFSPPPSTANPTTPPASHLPPPTKPQLARATFCLLADPGTAEPSDHTVGGN